MRRQSIGAATDIKYRAVKPVVRGLQSARRQTPQEPITMQVDFFGAGPFA
jgi:hypothetical protein